jgi:hypothetical protein
VPTFDSASAALAIRTRQAASRADDIETALREGDVVQAFAFRGAVHYLSAEDGGAYLALRAAGRQWELPSWREYYRLEPSDWPAFRETVRAALADGPLTIAELGAAVTARAAYRHLRPVFDEGAGTLVKPLSWQGDMVFGPPRDGTATFQGLEGNPHWAGIWDLDDAGRHCVLAYLGTYGPATAEHLHYWLGNGLSAGARRLRRWVDEVADRLAEVDVEGERAWVLAEHVDGLLAAERSDAVRLLPGHDQWAMGPGTKDEHVVPPAARQAVTRKSPLVVVGGVVAGTWTRRGDVVTVTWAERTSGPSRSLVGEEVARLGRILGRPLELVLEG